MLKEEKELREWLSAVCGNPREHRAISRRVTALVRAVREECAKKAESIYDQYGDSCETAGNVIAAAIRRAKGGK